MPTEQSTGRDGNNSSTSEKESGRCVLLAVANLILKEIWAARGVRGEKDKVESYLDLYILQDARTHPPASQPASSYYGLSALLRAEALCAPQMFADIKK